MELVEGYINFSLVPLLLFLQLQYNFSLSLLLYFFLVFACWVGWERTLVRQCAHWLWRRVANTCILCTQVGIYALSLESEWVREVGCEIFSLYYFALVDKGLFGSVLLWHGCLLTWLLKMCVMMTATSTNPTNFAHNNFFIA